MYQLANCFAEEKDRVATASTAAVVALKLSSSMIKSSSAATLPERLVLNPLVVQGLLSSVAVFGVHLEQMA